jgi:hypothetical protein
LAFASGVFFYKFMLHVLEPWKFYKYNKPCGVAMAKKNYNIVLVEWVDAEEKGEVGWNDMKEMLKYAKKPCPVMRSVGFEVWRDKDHIALLSTLGVDDCSTCEKIPLGFIKNITTLEATKVAEDAKRNPLKND